MKYQIIIREMIIVNGKIEYLETLGTANGKSEEDVIRRLHLGKNETVEFVTR